MICINVHQQRSLTIKRSNVKWLIASIVFVWTLHLVSMGEAYSGRIHIPRHTLRKTSYEFQYRQEHSGRVFVRKFGWKEIEFSDEQKTQLREQFGELLVTTAEIQQELTSIRQELVTERQKASDNPTKVITLQSRLRVLAQRLRAVRAHYVLAIKAILTSEQIEKLRQRRSTARMWYRFKAELQKLVLESKKPEIKILSQLQTAFAEKNVTLEPVQFETFVQVSTILSPKQSLHTLQILRL